jgi:hypothetical protein
VTRPNHFNQQSFSLLQVAKLKLQMAFVVCDGRFQRRRSRDKGLCLFKLSLRLLEVASVELKTECI